jgi:hypothetical protein
VLSARQLSGWKLELLSVVGRTASQSIFSIRAFVGRRVPTFGYLTPPGCYLYRNVSTKPCVSNFKACEIPGTHISFGRVQSRERQPIDRECFWIWSSLRHDSLSATSSHQVPGTFATTGQSKSEHKKIVRTTQGTKTPRLWTWAFEL